MIDIRVQKTKAAIKKVFYELVFRMPISKITVQELSSLALINRKTFYAHYDNVADIVEEDIRGFFEDVKPVQEIGREQFVADLVSSIEKSHSTLAGKISFKSLFDENYAIFTQYWCKSFSACLMENAMMEKEEAEIMAYGVSFAVFEAAKRGADKKDICAYGKAFQKILVKQLCVIPDDKNDITKSLGE